MNLVCDLDHGDSNATLNPEGPLPPATALDASSSSRASHAQYRPATTPKGRQDS